MCTTSCNCWFAINITKHYKTLQNVTKTEKVNHRVKSDAKEIKLISNEIRKREEYVFVQKTFCHLENKMLNGNGKLIFYAKVKKHFGQEDYLKLRNVQNRNVIRDIWMSTHKLRIESGRYEKIAKDYRLCNYCNLNKIESEEHFMLKCPNYQEERSNFLDNLAQRNNKYIHNRGAITIINVFEDRDPTILNRLGNFLNTCWEKRTITDILQGITQIVIKSETLCQPRVVKKIMLTQGGG